MSALSKKQKWILVQLAGRAFRLAGAKARGGLTQPGETLQESLAALAANGSEGCFETWRHEQVRLACGKGGLRLCGQLDYKRVESHFQHLLGEDGKALNAELKHGTEPARQARAVLFAACEKWGYAPGYAAHLCRKIHGVELEDAPAAVVWKVIYTVNNHGAARRRKQQQSTEGVMA